MTWRPVYWAALILLFGVPRPVLGETEAPTGVSILEEESSSSVVRELNKIRSPDEQKRMMRMLRGARVEESEGLLQFFKKRLHFGVGANETYNSNLFLRDNQESGYDWISALGGQVLFADPRGSLIYGAGYGATGLRYHHLNANALDHDIRAFMDVDPGGRYQYQADYRLGIKNALVVIPEGTDLIRRSTKFQRTITHSWGTQMRYSINESNRLVPKIRYSLKDDQAKEDSETDQRLLEMILDIDRDIRPGWVLYGGYGFTDVIIPGNELKNSDSQGIRLGVRHELTELSDLDLLLKLEHREWKSQRQGNSISFEGKWSYQLNSRTKFLLSYVDDQVPSQTASFLQFRDIKPSVGISYEATPLTVLVAGASYEQQRSSGKDVVTGVGGTTVVSRLVSLGGGWRWQFREQTYVTLDYNYSRSRTADFTDHVVSIGVKAQL